MYKRTIGWVFLLSKFPMGLDKELYGCLNKTVNVKLLLASMGFPAQGGVKGYIASLFGRGKQTRQTPQTQERERFEKEVKQEFLKLKEKGLSIPIFTL